MAPSIRWVDRLCMGHPLQVRIDSCLRLLSKGLRVILRGICDPLRTWCGLGYLNPMFRCKPVSTSCKLYQCDGRAIPWLRQASISNPADRRLIDSRFFRQLSLAETLGFQ